LRNKKYLVLIYKKMGVQAQPAPQIPGYALLPQTDAGGNDITHIDTPDINVCSNDCNNRVDCKGFNFNGKGCWIKHNVDNKGGTPDWNLYVKQQQKAQGQAIGQPQGPLGPIMPRNTPTKCIDISGGSKDNGAKVQLWDCNGSGAQTFNHNPVTGQLMNGGSGKCLDVNKGVNANGTKIQLWDCDPNNNNQKFKYDGNSYRWNDRCVDISGNSRDNGAQIQLWDCNGGDAQKFTNPKGQGIQMSSGQGIQMSSGQGIQMSSGPRQGISSSASQLLESDRANANAQIAQLAAANAKAAADKAASDAAVAKANNDAAAAKAASEAAVAKAASDAAAAKAASDAAVAKAASDAAVAKAASDAAVAKAAADSNNMMYIGIGVCVCIVIIILIMFFMMGKKPSN
jgi:hypothetical protein